LFDRSCDQAALVIVHIIEAMNPNRDEMGIKLRAEMWNDGCRSVRAPTLYVANLRTQAFWRTRVTFSNIPPRLSFSLRFLMFFGARSLISVIESRNKVHRVDAPPLDKG
jgi:hypothetical protein